MTSNPNLAYIKSCLKTHKVFIDSCSLLSDEAELFWSNVLPILYSSNTPIIVPYTVFREIENFAESKSACIGKQPGLHERAKKVKDHLIHMHNEKMIRIMGDKNDDSKPFADNEFITVFTQHRLNYNLLLITNDNKLAADILSLKNQQSVHTSNDISVKKITPDGFLTTFNPSTSSTKNHNKGSNANQAGSNSNVASAKKFALAKSITTVSGNLAITQQPAEGSTVYAGPVNGSLVPIKLQSKVSAGGEGTIFTTNIPGIVAKIYFPNKVTKEKFEKLKLMMSKGLKFDGICFPIDMLYNGVKEFVGFLMPQAKGKVLQHCVFIPRLLQKTFPNWNKIDTVQLSVTILQKINFLHDHNVILGDINPSNILVVSPQEVYFVDTDSYQIEGFPCPVGTINYTAPEIQRKHFSTFLRSKETDYFAVATLLFMIMLPGKPPYSIQGGDSQVDNIINGKFAYPSGTRSSGKVPEGMWRYCWSHLPRSLKDDFYETFHKNGEHYSAGTRFPTAHWLNKFNRYLGNLQDGTMASNDAMSLQIFPTRFKKQPNVNYIHCKLCGTEIAEDRAKEGICGNCLRQEISYPCANCGQPVTINNFLLHIKKLKKPKLCKNCNNALKAVYTSMVCPDCGQLFSITNGEKQYFDSHGLSLPKRCPQCRKNHTSSSSYSSSRNTTRRFFSSLFGEW